ncbi:hypothetical protein [Pontivivens ytuae]|uniref:Beta-ketoacyl synthase N-terminal domain-containing protein n=1 Tax=Pontivivens ytuae TaxID=2789856 RepID=A0A7S9LVI2_9RHOB|nr:hypothetical protein [Pontivivens ytuae]QPH56034.1 hypothetical protein I0K15_10055 [Pontivivens ytuae]
MSEIVYLSIHEAVHDLEAISASDAYRDMARRADLSRWKRCSHVTVPLLLGAREAMAQVSLAGKEIGVISVGADLNVNHTQVFLTRARRGQPDLINPLDFPHTLNSGVPSSLAQALGAKAFALVCGDGPSGVVAALKTASGFFSVGFGRAALITVSQEDPIWTQTGSDIAVRGARVVLVTATPRQQACCLDLADVEGRDAWCADVMLPMYPLP